MAKKAAVGDEKSKIMQGGALALPALPELGDATARSRFVDDVKFAEGDSDNLYQWPDDIRGRMEKTRRPC
jgi:hypothetical protein